MRNLRALDIQGSSSSKYGTILDALASNDSVAQGRGYEDGLRIRKYLGSGVTGGSDASGIDPVDGAESDGSKVYEVKRTEKSSNVMLDKALRYVIDTGRMTGKRMRGVDEVDTFKVPPLIQYTMPADLPARAKEVRDQLAAQSAAKGGKRKKVKVAEKNSGGPISGEDTVPALLTPGEFVINKKSAQAIGRATLNRMNTQGYNKGGSVHPKGPKRMFFGGFMGGGGGDGGASLDVQGTQSAIDMLGVTSSKLSIAQNNLIITTNQLSTANIRQLQTSGQISQAQAQAAIGILKSSSERAKESIEVIKASEAQKDLADSADDAADALDKSGKKNNTMFNANSDAMMKSISKVQKFSGGLSLGIAMLQGFLPPLEENSSAMTKAAHAGLGFVLMLSTAITALATFAASLEGTAIMNLFSNAFKGFKVGDIFKFLSGQGGKIMTGIGKMVRVGVKSLGVQAVKAMRILVIWTSSCKFGPDGGGWWRNWKNGSCCHHCRWACLGLD